MRKKYVNSESRARIVLSRERDIERKLNEKERITLQLEEYIKHYADLTGEDRVVDSSLRRKGKRLKAYLITIGIIVVLVGGFIAYRLLF